MNPVKTLAAAGLVAAAVTLAPHHAAAMSFELTGPAVSGTPAFPSVTVTRGANTQTVGAGAFAVKDADFVAWCFDLDVTFTVPGTYSYTLDPDLLSGSAYAAGAQQRVQNLFDKAFDPDVVLASKAHSAGFQLAIWNALYDGTSPNTVSDGDFTASGNAAAVTFANQVLLGLDTWQGPQEWILTTYAWSGDDPAAQALGVATPIPLPAAAWLLLAASGGLIAAKRRQRARA